MLSHVLIIFDVHNNPARWKERFCIRWRIPIPISAQSEPERLRVTDLTGESQESSLHLQKLKAMYFWPKQHCHSGKTSNREEEKTTARLQ